MTQELFWLFILSLPVACISWTVTHEEIFHESRDWCAQNSQHCRSVVARKFFYVWTCEYCFSHYVAALTVWVCNFYLLIPDWRGYLIAWLSLIAIANVYMSIYGRVRVEIKKEQHTIQALSRPPEDSERIEVRPSNGAAKRY